jgi:aspartyl protease family protein
MATGFMFASQLRRNFTALLLALVALPAAADVSLVGVIGDKAAVIAIDGGAPKTVRVGQTWQGVTVVAVEKTRATVEIDGKRRVLLQGQSYRSAAATDDRQSATLAADDRGHFMADGLVNGGSVRFMVDTGATTVALPAGDAQRLGINYRRGEMIATQTANGAASAWRVKLTTVRIGDIEMSNVDCIVIEGGLQIALLGMSFLNRVEIRRDGQTMVLTRRF